MKINALLTMSLLVGISTFLTSCREDPLLTVDCTAINLPATGGYEKFTINANEEAGTWYISSDQSWVSLSQTLGANNQTITVSAKKNESVEQLSAILTIQSEAGTNQIFVTQDEGASTLSVSSNTFSLSAVGGTVGLNISSNTKWIITGLSDWCKADMTSGDSNSNVNINVEANHDIEQRTCTFVITTKDGKVSQKVDICQSGVNLSLSVSPSSLSFMSSAKQTKNLIINATGKWIVTNIDNVDWLSFDSEGEGNTTIEVATKTANESANVRTARLEISLLSNKSISQTVSISQDPSYSDIAVKPANWVAVFDELYEAYEITWEYEAVEKKHRLNHFRYLLLPESDLNNWTPKEIRQALSEQELLKFSRNWLSTLVYDSNGNWLIGGTNYRFYSIGYDENDAEGDVYDETIRVPIRDDENDDAYITFSDISYGMNVGFSFNASLDGRAKKYHVIYGNNDEDINIGSIYAFEMNYYLKYGKKHWYASNWELEIQTYYPNSHTFTYYTNTLPYYPVITAWGWGVFEDGTMSKSVTGFDYDLSNETASCAHRVTKNNSLTGPRFSFNGTYDVHKTDKK